MNSPLIHNSLNAQLPTVDRGEGVWLWDAEGARYLDGCSGAVVTAIGHAHPAVLSAIADQASRVAFTHRGAFTNAPLVELADRVAALTGYAGVWFVNSGSEAVEAAMQFALQYFRELGAPQRTVFLSARRGYHGNTLGALSASGHARRRAVEGIALDIPALPTPYAFADQGELTEDEYCAQLLAEARVVFERHANTLAGILVEPIGGATLAATTPPRGYLLGLKALCDEFGALFIADEVMSGLGRTGDVLATFQDGVRADLVAIGKALGAGYTPIAATLVDARILRAIENGSGRVLGGHTYGGNPLSAAVAVAVLEVFRTECLVARAEMMGAALAEGLRDLAEKHPLIADTRGRGMLRGVEFSDRDAASRPQGELAGRVFAAAVAEGLLVYPTTGGYNDAVLVAPPLTITPEELVDLLDRFDRALSRVELELEGDADGVVPEASGSSSTVPTAIGDDIAAWPPV
jgi:adenosylmethionine-8-amino-7-oxononanoate aminotransferase